MAYEDSNAGLPAPAHPMANPGYGKRSVPDADLDRPVDFSQLSKRAEHIATLIDGLPEGAAMDVKTLAKSTRKYGQRAVSGALNELSQAGHLRRVRQLVTSADGGFRWVFHTRWSRTAHDDAWWSRDLRADAQDGRPAQVVGSGPVIVEAAAPGPAPEAADRTAVAPVPVEEQPRNPARSPQPQPQPSSTQTQTDLEHREVAHQLLAELAHTTPQLTLSAADCTALQDLAAQWLARGATPAYLTRTLTADLPDPIRFPRAFVQYRLRDKLPPEPVRRPDPAHRTGLRPPRTIMECTGCGVPGRPEALPEGLCRACRSEPGAEAGAHTSTADVRSQMPRLRAVLAARPALSAPRTASESPAPRRC